LDFILSILDKLSKNSVDKDYTETYIKKLKEVSFDELPFQREELLERLPKILPSSNYHGDLTLENIIFTADRGFFLIDCATIEYDSYIFDIAKLRQDLELGWFTRKDNVMLDVKTKHIQQQILEQYPDSKHASEMKFAKLLDDRFIYAELNDGSGTFYEIKKDRLYVYKRHAY
jgi:aminoglycoside phosphotransferase